MNDNQITITVSGPAGSGKTAIARVIMLMLKIFHIDANFTDPDNPDDTSCTLVQTRRSMSAISGRTTVNITEKQSARSALQK